MIHIRFIAIIILLQGIFVSTIAQPLSKSRQTSQFSYVYRITSDEARQVLSKGIRAKDMRFFHTLADSVPTDSLSLQYKVPGHYLKTNSLRNKQEVEYLFVPSFDLKVLNNNTDLCLRVYNLQGQILKDATISIGGKILPRDADLECFIEKKSNRKGLIRVQYQGETAYFELKRNQNNPVLLRVTRKVLYQTPFNYVWRPVRFLTHLPIDGVKSIVKGWPQGTIRQTNNFMHQFSNNRQVWHQGYMVFDKPKYLPRDTVRFKAFLVNSKAVPLDKEMHVMLYGRNKKVKLTTLKPFRPGAFEYGFFLHDSLELLSDRHYNIAFEDEKSNRYYQSSFRYEDYELTPLKLELLVPKETHFRGTAFKLKVRGTDENGLSLKDGRLEIILTNQRLIGSTAEKLFIPNLLWKHQSPLQPTGETEIQIPDSIFPEGANLQYKMQVKLINSANQSVQQEKYISFVEFKREFKFSIVGDSVQLTYVEKEDEKPVHVSIWGIDHFENETPVGQFITPCRFPLNVFYEKYRAVAGDFQSEMKVVTQDALLQCFSFRTHDSLFVEMANPRKLHFNYHVYQRNREIDRGSGFSLNLKQAVKGKDNFFVTLSYLWGGHTRSQTFKIAFQDKKLKVNMIHPEIIYPGQTATLEVLVTDAFDRPVQGVDLTAMSHTGKFDYQPPTLPYLGKRRPDKELINNFTVEAVTEKDLPSLPLNYEAWKTLASLDTIPLYQFLFPEKTIFRHEQKMRDGITQFAPFVVSDKGATQPILVVYLNSKPVYFGWNTNQQRYAFRVNPNTKQTIQIRTRDRLTTLKNLEFREGFKTILSIPYEQEIPGVEVQKMPSKLSKDETRNLNRYIFPYRNRFDSPAFLIQDDNIQNLNEGSFKRKSNFAGPVAGELSLDVRNNYQLQFAHEPGFQYDFSPKIIKMREFDKKSMPTGNMFYLYGKQPWIGDSVLTTNETDAIYRHYIETLRQNFNRYWYPHTTQPGFGQLSIINSNHQNKPLNTVVTGFGSDRVIRIYGKGNPILQQLQQGYYQLISLYADGGYRLTDSVWVQADGHTLINENFERPLSYDTSMDSFTRMIEALVLKQKAEPTEISAELNQLYNNIQIGDTFDGDVLTVRLKESSVALEEVVVIGYGTSAKQLVTGSITITDQLSGRVAGLDVTNNNIRVRGASSISESLPLIIVDGKVYTGDLNSIEHGNIASMNVLKSENAMSIYGNMAAGGAIIITTKFFTDLQKPEVPESDFPDFSEMSSMRSNFSDVAFWQPQLITDKTGRAKFDVTFPDDITQWKSYVFAMNEHRQTGQTSAAIRSFKPLMAQLSVPAVLAEGDICAVVGKTLNYTADTVDVRTTFTLGGELLHEREGQVSSVLIDTLRFVMPADSVTIQYRMQRTDGYFDGEERMVPVRPVGLEEAHGRYLMLEGDTAVSATFMPDAGKVTLYAQSGFLPLLENEIDKLYHYQYWCNEQIASKLKALLAERTIARWKGVPFRDKHEIEKCIRLLLKNRNEDRMWGWWPRTQTHWDFSVHILEALMQARSEGFRVMSFDDKLISELVWKLKNAAPAKLSEGIALLRILQTLIPEMKYPEYLLRLEAMSEQKPVHQMQIAILKLQYGITTETSFMEQYRKETMLGSTYYSDRGEDSRYIRNDLEFTLLAYRLHQLSAAPDSVLQPIRRWFGESVQRPGGWNTFEAAQIINVLLPDLTKAQQDKPAQPTLQITGSIQKLINEFPYKTEIAATDSIHIAKTGNDVVWISTWQRRLNPEPPVRAEVFDIKTAFENNKLNQEAGKPVKLVVNLNVTKDAAYVMLHIPIPGGFSYAEKPQSWSRNEHREYLRGETQLYFEYLPQGQHRYEILLVPRFTGTFTLNPARAELMYFPVFNGNNGVQRVKVW